MGFHDQASLKRRKPGFSESYYGFRSFGALLEGAEAQGILELERDQKSAVPSSKSHILLDLLNKISGNDCFFQPLRRGRIA